jgi:hypothetical protein
MSFTPAPSILLPRWADDTRGAQRKPPFLATCEGHIAIQGQGFKPC